MNFIVNHSGEITSVLFFTMFTGIALWAYLPRNRHTLEEYAKIPLERDPHDGQ